MNTMERQRLFVAIDLPAAVKTPLARLRINLDGVRPVPAEQLHLTLRFIGDVDTPTLELVKSSLAEIHAEPFSLAVSGLGHFPPSRFPRVLWVGVEPVPLLLQLQHKVELAVRSAGIAVEERPFSPHITIARLKEVHLEQVRRFELQHQDFIAGTLMAENFHLYASRLSPAGATHTRLQSYTI